MSYIALYRKWRPSTFDEIKGQDAIVGTLRNQLLANRIGHAYLFCGTRGTGKTSAAKVFAKAINCENTVNGSPCGECASCKSIAAGNSMNVVEMDAASNNGVENVRNIIEDVVYPPVDAKYKIYIIDEAHMMTKEAFNALLKTLEEPPSYVVFILATTEPHKLPITILSRCQRYDFKRISTDVIVDRLAEVTKSENLEVEEKALAYIARRAEGGMRDALSMLDQCISFFLGQPVTYDKTLDVLGAVDTSVFSELLRDLVARSVIDAYHVVEKVMIQGRNLDQFVSDFTWHLRNVLLMSVSNDAAEVIDLTEDNLKLLVNEAKVIPSEQILRYIRVFSELANNMKFSTQKRVLLEIAIIRICQPQMETSYDSLIDRIKYIEDMVENGDFVKTPKKDSPKEAEDSSAKKDLIKSKMEEARNLPKATQEELGKIAAMWPTIRKKLPDNYSAYVRNAIPSVRTSDGKLVLKVENNTVKGLCELDSFMSDIGEIFENISGRKVEFEIVAEQEAAQKGEYYPPADMFGMDIEISDDV